MVLPGAAQRAQQRRNAADEERQEHNESSALRDLECVEQRGMMVCRRLPAGQWVFYLVHRDPRQTKQDNRAKNGNDAGPQSLAHSNHLSGNQIGMKPGVERAEQEISNRPHTHGKLRQHLYDLFQIACTPRARIEAQHQADYTAISVPHEPSARRAEPTLTICRIVASWRLNTVAPIGVNW